MNDSRTPNSSATSHFGTGRSNRGPNPVSPDTVSGRGGRCRLVTSLRPGEPRWRPTPLPFGPRTLPSRGARVLPRTPQKNKTPRDRRRYLRRCRVLSPGVTGPEPTEGIAFFKCPCCLCSPRDQGRDVRPPLTHSRVPGGLRPPSLHSSRTETEDLLPVVLVLSCTRTVPLAPPRIRPSPLGRGRSSPTARHVSGYVTSDSHRRWRPRPL